MTQISSLATLWICTSPRGVLADTTCPPTMSFTYNQGGSPNSRITREHSLAAWMISKPENFGKIILISAAQRKKTLHEEKDKGDAKTITLLHNQVFLAPQRNCTKSQIHRRPGCQGPKQGKHTEPFLRVTGTESSKPGLLSRDAALQEPATQAYITSVCSAVCLQQPPKVPPPTGTALLRVAPAMPAALPH